MALGQSYDCPSAIEVTLEDMGKYTGIMPQQNKRKTKHAPVCIYFGVGVVLYCNVFLTPHNVISSDTNPL